MARSTRHLAAFAAAALLCARPGPVSAQVPDPAITLNGVIDIHVHQGPDSGGPRDIDADDLARLARQMGERGLVYKNHWESTAAMAYLMRKQVPGIELFGGITQDLAVGGINLAAVKQMADMAGHYGRIVWLPTYDSEISVRHADGKGQGPYVPIQKDGKLLPSVLELFDYIGQHNLLLESGHISPAESLLMVPEARRHGVQHIVLTHALSQGMTIPQMREAAKDGAIIEFVYAATLGPGARLTVKQYADAIRAVGARNCIISTDLGGMVRNFPRPLPPQGMLDFMNALHREGISVADIDLMAKTNPAIVLGVKP